MKGFEEYFRLADGLHFDTPRDRENALWAALWASRDTAGGVGRPPLVVIQGPHMAGKSLLARRIVQYGRVSPLLWILGMTPGELVSQRIAQYGETPDSEYVTVARTLGESDFNMAAVNWAKFLIFDNVTKLEGRAQGLIESWVASDWWGCRQLRSEKMQNFRLDCMTIITVQPDFKLPARLAKRSLLIKLYRPDLSQE